MVLAAGLLLATAVLDPHLDIDWKVRGSSYDVLFETIGAITGVFLGLYFAAVSTVAATAYADVPTETRDLLVREKLGNGYVRLVAFLAAFSVGALGLHATGHGPWRLTVGVAVIGTAAAIFAFVALGRRAFQFFDPVALASLALSDLASAVRRAVAFPHAPTERAAFRARNDARRVADALDSLVALAVERRRLRGSGLVTLLRQILSATSYYVLAKPAIPTRSRWFGTRYQHRQWYLSESTPLELASRSLQPLQPEEVPDPDWLEEDLLRPVRDVVTRAATTRDFETLWLVLRPFVDVASASAAAFNVQGALRWIDPLVRTIVEAVTESGERPTERERTHRIAVVGVTSQLAAELEVSVFRRIDALTAADLDHEVRAVDVASRGNAYRLSHRLALPRRSIENLEVVIRGREFEELASVGTKTPSWYVRDLVANSLLWAVHEEWRAANEYVLSLQSLANELSTAGYHLEGATVRTAALAASWRLARHVETVDQRDEELRGLLVLRDLQQPTWDRNVTEEAFERFRLGILEDMARSIPELASIPQSGREMPDYLGEAVHRAGDACYEALERNDAAQFQRLFGAYFLGILAVADRIRPQVADWWPDTAGPWLAAPVIDLVTMSGYARIFADLHQNPELWDRAHTLWDRWLAENDDRLRVLNAMLAIERGTFALQPRGILRTQWEMRLSATLNALLRTEPDTPWDDGRLDHPSPLVRALSPHDGLFMSYRAIDVFTALYLQTRPNVGDLTFGLRGSHVDHVRNLRDLVENPSDEEDDG